MCSYDGYMIFELIEGIKDVHSNKLTLTYSVSPYLYFLSDFQDLT